ncbi:MAG: mono/diheme cytochrome c family protein [Cellvibrionaceae bacterium]|jgi:mono/diheme cytochrome c family protein
MGLARWAWWLSPAIALSAIALYWLWQPLMPQLSLGELRGDSNRGAYLARMSGCITCHSDSGNGYAALSGGKALKTPFGEFRAPNITTDKKHGIGSWTPQQFANAVREGISPEGKPYYPAFPYTFYRQFSDQDIVDLWAAFQTVPPASVADPEQTILFPFNLRQGVKAWRVLYFDPESFQKNAQQSDQYNRGKFIVEVAAHCGACHTPRNSFGALDTNSLFEGGYDSAQSRSPAITAAALEEKGWTPDDLAYALQTGITYEGDVFGGSMSDVVQGGTAFLTWEDLLAIANYLFSRTDKEREGIR